MKKGFTPIAMKCSKEQFKSIKPKIKKIGKIGKLTSAFENYEYLTNNCSSNSKKIIFDFIDKGFRWEDEHQNNVHETWNEKVFLEACGIETEQEYTITKEQIKRISRHFKQTRELDVDILLKEWFPEAFETVLEVGKWYKATKYDNLMFCFNGKVGIYTQYGFNMSGGWCEELGIEQDKINLGFYVEATESEVFEALKNEAVKRGFVSPCIYKPTESSKEVRINSAERWGFIFNENKLLLNNYRVFHDGKWAEIIPTLTRKEAENKLGVKIVD